jgi:hypothetical protein
MLTIQVLWVVKLSAGDADPDVSKQCTSAFNLKSLGVSACSNPLLGEINLY